jgi:sugar phosphate permease
MDTTSPPPKLPTNVKVLGGASLLNDTASEAIVPLLPAFLLTSLGGNVFIFGIIEGVADSVASCVKLWSGGRSDRAGRRKGFVLVGYALAVLARPLIGLIRAPWQLLFLRSFVYAGIYLAFALATTAWQAWTYFLGYALFSGLTEPAEKTLVAELAGPQRRGLAYGWYNFAMDIGTLPASAIFGALYQGYGPRTAFGWGGAGLALVAALLLATVRVPVRA